jgi:N-acetylmuramoyl-L-alanine amidase
MKQASKGPRIEAHRGSVRAAAHHVRVLVLALAIMCGQQAVAALAFEAPGRIIDATDYRMAGDATRTRIVLQLAEKPSLSWFVLRGPYRLVVDLPETRFSIDPERTAAHGLVTEVRYGQLGEGRSRMIVSAAGPFQVEAADVLANDDGKTFRLVIDLAAAGERDFETALSRQTLGAEDERGVTAKGDRIGSAGPAAPRRFTIVLDPGHGGIDGGANGDNGAVEKDVTLAFALELEKHLEAGSAYDVRLTREGDDFLRLDERVRIGRQHQADLFISIHADTIRVKGLRGATVYTVSDKASDAEAEALAIRENLSDELAGISVADADHKVADILADLIRRETHGFSIRFARSLVGELSGQVELVNNPHREAGFKVLRAPDVPSVLLELGYLSNEKDEAQLLDPEWRGKAVRSIASAIALFASAKAGPGG